MLQNTAGIARHIIYAPTGPHGLPSSGSRLWPVGCGETAPAARVAGGEESWARQADALATSVGGALDRIAAPMARAAAELVGKQGWFEFGFARLEDHARERFGRSGRWVREMAALGEALGRLPALEAALGGQDGGPPLGVVAAMLIGRAANSDSVATWIGLARRVSVREFKSLIREARANGSVWPPGASAGIQGAPAPREQVCLPSSAAASVDAGQDNGPQDGDAPRELVRLVLPQQIRAAFDEAADLFRAIEGHEMTLVAFVEALVAEAASGLASLDESFDMTRAGLVHGKRDAVSEAALCHSTNGWEHLPTRSASSWALALAGASLRRFEELSMQAGSGDAVALDGQIRELLELEDGLQRRLGDLLLEMSRMGAWQRLRFDGCAHYAEQRLGLSRSAASERLHAARSLRQLPLVWRAYQAGEVGLESARHILRVVCGPGGAGLAGADPAEFDAVQQHWLSLARNATVKRMRDEARLHGRHLEADWRLGGSPGPGKSRAPLDDAAWHACLRREPGMSRARVMRWGLEAAEAVAGGARGATYVPDVFLRLSLPADVAADLLASITASRRRLERQAGSVPWDETWPAPGAPAPSGSLRAARHYFVGCRRAPAWVGLLALLEDFVDTWDVGQRARGDEVYVRDGYRCTAPGCSSRRNLEAHHIVYRSRGGGDELANRTCLCRFHHQRGEHGGLASCRGAAPLGIVWRMGRHGVGGEFLNERRIDYGAVSACRGGNK